MQQVLEPPQSNNVMWNLLLEEDDIHAATNSVCPVPVSFLPAFQARDNEEFAEQRPQSKPRDLTVRDVKTVSGAPLPVISGRFTTTLEFANGLYSCTFLVVRDLNYDALLGRDFLTTNGAVINLKHSTLQLEESIARPHSEGACHVRVLYNCVIPAISEALIPPYLDQTYIPGLTKKGLKFQWSDAYQSAFETLKEALTQATIMAYPEFTLEFTLTTDTSDHGLGYVLGQVQNGREVVIAYGGRKLLPA